MNDIDNRDIDWEAYEGDTILVYIDSTSTYKELVLYKYDPNVDTPFICLLPGSTRLYLGRHAILPEANFDKCQKNEIFIIKSRGD